MKHKQKNKNAANFFDVQFNLDFVPKNVAYQLDLFNYSHKQKHKNAAIFLDVQLHLDFVPKNVA